MSPLTANPPTPGYQAGRSRAPVMEHDRPVLVVDDDEIILVALAETLRPEGYRIVQAATPIEALEILEREEFSVIISDQRMAEMTGLEFLTRAKRIQPHASRILITGVLTLKTVIEAINRGEIYRFLAKPWIREELLATVKNAAQRYQLLHLNNKLQEDTQKLNESLARANSDLHGKVQELTAKQRSLDEANDVLERRFNQSLDLCYRIIDAFHPGLGKGTRSVMDLCRAMTDTGQIEEDDARELRVAAILHNIGLIGISREVYRKATQAPFSLTEGETQQVQNHTIYGQKLASFVEDMGEVGRVIRAHHERWDGLGYPDGLAGEAIPRVARYLAVPVFYVECGLPKEEAIEAIMADSGKAFDPEAVRLFMKATRLAPLPKAVKEVTLREMHSGMVLASDISSPGGVLLLPEGTSISESALKKIRDHNQVENITQRILVYL